jgi:very-short-patch-repair endonuclease
MAMSYFNRKAGGLISKISCYLKNSGVNVKGKKHKAIIRLWAKQNGKTIPDGVELKQWLIEQFPDYNIKRKVRETGKKKKPKSPKRSTKTLGRNYCEELRKRATKAEKHFRRLLGNLKIRFVFQKVIPNSHSFYIVDFYLPDTECCIEIDGEYHNDPIQKWKDSQRDKFLESKGYQAIRFTNEEVLSYNELDLREILGRG